MSRRDFYLLLALSLPFAVLNLWRGQPVEYDLMNYHFYVPFGVLEGRFGHDIDAAQMQTYLNPLVDIPFYLFNKVFGFHSSVFGFLQGFLQGMTAFVYFKILSFFYSKSSPESDVNGDIKMSELILLALGALLCTATPTFLDLLGTAFNDSTVSILWLIAFYFLLSYRGSTSRLLIAGVFAGVGTGIKLTNLVFLVPLVLFVLLVLNFRRRPAMFLILGTTLGLVLGGSWGFFLWVKFGNPMFPFYNGIFANPYMNNINFSPKDANFLPDDWRDIYRIPIFLLDNKSPVIYHYLPFSDARMLAMLGLGSIAVFVGVFRRINEFRVIGRDGLFLIVFWIIGYLLWFKTSMVYRYFMVGDQLIPLLIFMFVSYLAWAFRASARTQLAAFLIVMLGLFIFQKTPRVERFAWRQEFFEVKDVASFNAYADAMVLMPANDNVSFIAPYFPRSTRFVRIQGSLDQFQMKTEWYSNQIRETVSAHKGPIYSMRLKFPDGTLNFPREVMIGSKTRPATTANSIEEALARYELIPTDDCRNIETVYHHFDDFTICRVERRAHARTTGMILRE